MSERALTTRAVEARAKVNLFLRVLGTRSDGFHELETLVLPISLGDQLEIHADADPSFRTLSFSLDLKGDEELIRGIPRDETNLAIRAGLALAERAGVRGFADITLEKRIPPAAGLGGGSADAAAVLTALNDLWRCGLDGEALRRLGASVGSDVPALLMGGPALARGRGELTKPVDVRELWLAIVTFPFGVSTPDAFRWWDEAGRPTGPDLVERLGLLRSGIQDVVDVIGNDLEEVVSRRHPEIGDVKRMLLEGGAIGAAMSGSGPTVFGVLPGPGARLDPDAERKVQAVARRPPIYVRGWSEPRLKEASWPPAIRTRISGTKTRRPACWTKGQ